MNDDRSSPLPPQGSGRKPLLSRTQPVKKTRPLVKKQRRPYPVAKPYAPPPNYPTAALPTVPLVIPPESIISPPPGRRSRPSFLSGTVAKGLGLFGLALLSMAVGWLIFRGSLGKALLGKNSVARANSTLPTRQGETKNPRAEKEPTTTSKPTAPPSVPLKPAPSPTTEPEKPVETSPMQPMPRDNPLAFNTTFDQQILPIFEARCIGCHGGEKKKGRLDARTVAALLKGGGTGPAVTPGSLENSVLWDEIRSDHMPPGKNKLTAAQKMMIQNWILGSGKVNS